MLFRSRLYRLLTNPIYTGNVEFKGQVYNGEHEAIVEAGTWERVQETLHRNGRSGGNLTGGENRPPALRGNLGLGRAGGELVEGDDLVEGGVGHDARHQGGVHGVAGALCVCSSRR